MHDDKIIKAIQSSGRLNKAQSKLLEVLYKTSINNESDSSTKFLSSTYKNCSIAYISKILKELVELDFISFKYAKGSNNQVFILNADSLDLLLKSYELKRNLII